MEHNEFDFSFNQFDIWAKGRQEANSHIKHIQIPKENPVENTRLGIDPKWGPKSGPNMSNAWTKKWTKNVFGL